MAPAVILDSSMLQTPSEPHQTSTATTVNPHNNLFTLGGRTIVITGGGGGLGIELIQAVIDAGGDAACLDIPREPSPEFVALQKFASSNGLHATYHCCDVTDESQTKGVLEGIAAGGMSRGKPLRGVVTCAGIQQMVPALDYPVNGLRKMLDVNVVGTFIPAKHSARIFIEQKTTGSIVMIASMSGQIANRGLTCSAYNSSKAAVHQMCRSVAQEWGQYGVRVNTLSAGYIRTAMTDCLLAEKPDVEQTWMRGALLNRLGRPGDFKAPTIYMLADGSSFMTGADLRVDGGHCASA